MNVGLMFSFRNPPKWKKPWADVYESQLEHAKLAEDLGYDTVWLTEHHFAEDGYSPSLMTLAGAVAAKTRRVRIGTFLLLLPLHNAVRVAEDAATVDVISRGRFDLGIGKGYARHEFVGYGIPHKERASRFEEGIEVIRGIWTQDPFSFQGKHYNLQDIRLTPKPVQQPHPPLWVGALGPKAVDRAARLGCHFLGVGETSAYDEALRRHGRNPSDFSVAQLVWHEMVTTLPRERRLGVNLIKAGGVGGHDVVAGGLRQNRKRLLDLLHYARIGTIEMRIVRTPQDIAIEAELAHRGERAFVGIER